LYTFYSFISAIANVVQFRKSGRPILSAAKNLNLAGAVMSMFTLQTAMFSAFNQNGQSCQRLMNTVTGTAVCIIVIGIAVFMIIHSNKNINALMRGDLYGK
jgi:NADH:ubiquinone oxidoreductase subunit 6 (subunit J)